MATHRTRTHNWMWAVILTRIIFLWMNLIYIRSNKSIKFLWTKMNRTITANPNKNHTWCTHTHYRWLLHLAFRLRFRVSTLKHHVEFTVKISTIIANTGLILVRGWCTVKHVPYITIQILLDTALSWVLMCVSVCVFEPVRWMESVYTFAYYVCTHTILLGTPDN